MSGYKKAYKGLAWIVRLILAIIPVTAWINAILYRFSTGHIIAAILCIPFGGIAWILDLITVIISGAPTVFA